MEAVYRLGGEDYFTNQFSGLSASKGASSLVSDHFRYAMVLLCTHRFGDMLHYLWSKRQVFATVHLTVLGLIYGFIQPHTPLLQNPLNPLVQHYHQQRQVASATLQMSAINILQQFTKHQMFAEAPTVIIDYLASLRTYFNFAFLHFEFMDSSTKETLKYIMQSKINEVFQDFLRTCDTSLLQFFVGHTDNNFPGKFAAPRNQKGYLEHYFSVEEIRLLISSVALTALKTEQNLVRAIELYSVNSSYQEIMEIFVSQLMHFWSKFEDSYENEYEGKGQRKFWKISCENFLSNYESIIRSATSQQLSLVLHKPTRSSDSVLRSSQHELFNVLKILLSLTNIADIFYKEQQLELALSNFDELQLLPTSTSGSSFDSLNPLALQLYTNSGRFFDEVSVFIVKVILSNYEHLRSGSATRSKTDSMLVYADRNAKMTQLHLRWQNLSTFFRQMQKYFTNPDIFYEISKLDSELVWRL
jgi:hypothetical protein